MTNIKLHDMDLSSSTKVCSFAVEGIPLDYFKLTTSDKLALITEEFDIVISVEYLMDSDEIQVVGLVNNDEVTKKYVANLTEFQKKEIATRIKEFIKATVGESTVA